MDAIYVLPKLPEDKIIFLDNSIFNLNDYFKIYPEIEFNKNSEDFLNAELERLIEFSEILKENHAWTTITPVISEFEKGTEKYQIESQIHGASKRRKKLLYDLINQRQEVLQLISEKERLADTNMTDFLSRTEKSIRPRVRKSFLNFGQIPNKLDTDIKLISAAIAYSSQDSVAIYSHDELLLYTYARCAQSFNLENAFIISDKFDDPKKPEEWLKHIKPGTYIRYKEDYLAQNPKPSSLANSSALSNFSS